MTQITLRISSIGDIHNNQTNLAKIQTYLTTAKNAGKLDFFVHSGDMSSSSSSSSQMSACKAKFDAIGTQYFVSCGNHDVSGSACYANKSNGAEACGSCNFKTAFGYCHKITTFNKGGQDFQVVIPGILWSGSAYWKIDLAAASKTLPTVIVVHGPLMKPPGIPGCGAWDSLHTYAFSLKPGVDSLKTMATYSGHVHEACVSPTGTDINPTSNTLYVVQDAVGSSRCSSSENNFIGYTKVTYDTSTGASTKQYKKVNYTTAFQDPFPDVGPVTLKSITVSPANLSVSMGGTGQLSAICKDSNGNTMTCPNLTWSSGDTSKVTVDSTGKVTGVATGTANVKVVSGTIVSNASIVTVTLPPLLTSIGVTPVTASININGTVQATATCKDQNNNTMTCPGLTWNTSNNTIATVNSTGKVIGIVTGIANITVKSGSITSNALIVTVTTAPVGIAIKNPTPGLIYMPGEARVVRWTHTSATGPNVKIELLKAGVLVNTISSNTPNDDALSYTVPSVATGNDYRIRITDLSNASNTGISPTFTIQGSTPIPVLTSITVAPGTVSIVINGTTQLMAICRDQNNNTITCPILMWNTSNSTIATVDPTGKVTGITVGTSNITAKSGVITSNASLIAVIQPVEKKFTVYDVTQDDVVHNVGVTAILDPSGTLTKDQACVEVCNRLGLI